MNDGDTNAAHTLALNALVWVLQEPARADRFLALTGIAPEDIRGRIEDPALLDAVLGFLAAHEPDLVACAKALYSTPPELIMAREALAR